ncbi:hypothetical protein ACEPAI_6757 [Sanghuangporus weigelae]
MWPTPFPVTSSRTQVPKAATARPTQHEGHEAQAREGRLLAVVFNKSFHSYGFKVVSFEFTMMLASTLLALALANVVFAQSFSPTSTASIIQIIPAVDGVEGQVLGTGSAGETTYQLFGTLGGQLNLPFTATLVQDASHMSEAAFIQASGASLVIQAECAFTNSGAEASCVQAIVQPTLTTSLALTGVQSFTAVPILSGTAPPSFTGSASGSGGGSGSGSESVLPPSISTSASGSTATVVSGTSSAPSETATTSGALSRYSSISIEFAWSLILPVVISYLVRW